ncbi:MULTISPECIES: hypothetical protein [Pseudoalteromonas]|uniref:Uncharacterized protein n=1 Tax=Pseudoalteromonas obscura TaxID=3048491 RepID=A0ABT7EQW0_9GAMM|nr:MULTISPECIES: hypothetical protein [Pseudoalteromonas]MBQ4838141.1 hypothetical protein [Pseudoalteromonas luteoviolacea]MDK2597451.1 hypothetical protein [Pseudoalteromonas sp. P94(2023)]
MFKVMLGALFACSLIPQAHAAMPKSQIWLAKSHDNGITVKPLTSDDAYHNQPLVSAEGVYYTKEITSAERSQTDLFLYRFADNSHTNLTNTPESEYSPTIYPHKDGVSAIVVEPSGKQRLWFYPEEASLKPERIFEHIEPVGYHAWGKGEDLIMFILGEPHTLQFTDLSGHLPKVIAKDIGRSLAFNAKRNMYSFTFVEHGEQWFATYSKRLGSVKKHFQLPSSVKDYTWLDSDTLAYAIDNKVFTRNIDAPKSVKLWRNFEGYCKANITRLSFHEETLAFVCDR